jgi:3-oxoacyl-[acyl-carrier-protein] synthase-1
VSAVIGTTHVLCAIGSGTDQVWASVRAGIARISSSDFLDQELEPVQMGLVPEDGLASISEEIETLSLPARARRLLGLAVPSLAAVGKDLGGPVPLFLGLPELSPTESPWLVHMPAYLQELTDGVVERVGSAVVPHGRASALMALELALGALQTDPSRSVIVGGIDTYMDAELIDRLDSEQRILRASVMDGFIPGEGAAFFVLSGRATPDAGSHIVVNAVASSMDEGHRYGSAPAKGEGLANALTHLRQRAGQLQGPIGTTFAGFNGESFDAKMWGVARMRHNDFFSPSMAIEHPADKYGDAGAATGAILLALAAKSLSSGTRQGPALICVASDREPRACAVISAQPH